MRTSNVLRTQHISTLLIICPTLGVAVPALPAYGRARHPGRLSDPGGRCIRPPSTQRTPPPRAPPRGCIDREALLARTRQDSERERGIQDTARLGEGTGDSRLGGNGRFKTRRDSEGTGDSRLDQERAGSRMGSKAGGEDGQSRAALGGRCAGMAGQVPRGSGEEGGGRRRV